MIYEDSKEKSALHGIILFWQVCTKFEKRYLKGRIMQCKYPLVTNGRLLLPGYVNEHFASPEVFSGNVNYKNNIQFNFLCIYR